MMLLALVEVLRSAGLRVIEEPGWKTRGHGPMIEALGVTCHHTANGGAPGIAPSLHTVIAGRGLQYPEGDPRRLDGPLSHLFLDKAGTWHVVAAGLAYHAGASLHSDQTNSHRIGVEAEAKGVPGTVGDWPEVQMASYARGCAALARHYDFSTGQVLGHKETCSPPGRKSDPDFDMAAFRRRVATVRTDLARPAVPPVEVPEMIKLTTQYQVDTYNHRLAPGDVRRKKLGDSISATEVEYWGNLGMIRLYDRVEELEAKLDKVLSLLTPQEPTP